MLFFKESELADEECTPETLQSKQTNKYLDKRGIL